jgi:hypothetical protein
VTTRRTTIPSKPPLPFDLRRETRLAVTGPAVMTAAYAAAFAAGTLAQDAPPWLAASAVLLLAATAVSTITLFRGRLRRNWKGLLVFAAIAFASPILLFFPFQQFALEARGVTVDCTVEHVHDFTEYHRGTGSDQKSFHRLGCPGWPEATLETDVNDRLAIGTEVPVVFDPWNRVEPDPDGVNLWAAVLSVPGILALGAVAAFYRLIVVDDGSVQDMVDDILGRFRRKRRLR